MPEAALKTRPQEAKTPSDSLLTGTRLAEALNLHSRIIERRPTIPVLECVLLDATEGVLETASTDLDNILVGRLPYSGPPFAVCVPCHLLTAAAAAFGDEAPAIVVNNEHIILSGSAGEFALRFLPGDEFKRIERPAADATLTFMHDDLIETIDSCRRAISTEETQYYLNGILFKQKGDRIEAVATDGHRLHLRRLSPVALDGELPERIIHRRSVRCLKALLEMTERAEIDAEIGGSKASFSFGDWTLVAKCIDGVYPDYSRVIPDTFVGSMTLSGDVLAACLRSMAAIMHGDTCKAPALEPVSGRIRYRDTLGLTFTRALDGIVSGDAPEKVGFNIRYLSDILATHPDAQVTVKFSDTSGTSPMLITFSDDEDFLAALMPMRAPD